MRRVILLALVLAAAATATAGTFLPLTDNARWTYRNDAGQAMTITTTGYAVVRGIPCVELRWALPDQAFRNYWTSDRDGRVYLHGAINEDGGFEASYSTPIHWLPAASASARCWSTHTRMFTTLFGESNTGYALDLEFCVVGECVVSTPAGDFDSIAVSVDSQIMPTSEAAGYDAFGRRLGNSGRALGEEWFSLDVGMVRDDEWELVSYEEITANQDLAWGAVKALYR